MRQCLKKIETSIIQLEANLKYICIEFKVMLIFEYESI